MIGVEWFGFHAEADGVEIPNLADYEFLTPVFDLQQRADSEWAAISRGIFDCPVIEFVRAGRHAAPSLGR
ncbi:MAG: hypothetical protein L0387_14660 [Acidobacteria bacterium]|nr:hypothetical protein [Acidobacteriota bacterium]